MGYGPTQWTEGGLSATLALAVGGEFLQGHVLIVEALNGKMTWDGEPILQDFPSDWSVQGLITAHHHEVDEPIDRAQSHRPIHGVDVELPLGIRLTVNRWMKHLDLSIRMRPLAGGQDGHCGNFNGVADDTLDLINGRMELKVSKEELLFPKPNALADDAEPKVRELSACAPDARSKAEAQCRKALGKDGSAQVLEACVFDRCFGGSGFDN